MLIRINKKSKDLIEGKPHEAQTEVSRRAFLQKSLASIGSLTVLPSVVSLLKSNPARAAALSCSVAPLGTSYTQLCLAGGNGTARMAYAWGPDGNPLVGDSNALGTRAANGVNTTAISGIYLNTADPFYTSLINGGEVNANGITATRMFNAAMTTEILSRLSGSQIACPKGDDTDDNPVNVMTLFGTKCSLRKGYLSDVGGDAARDRSIDSLRNNFSILRYGGSVNNMVSAASLQSGSLNTNVMGASMNKAVGALTNEQKSKLVGRVGSQEYLNNVVAGISSGAGKFDPNTANLALNPAFGANAALFTGGNRAPVNGLSGKDLGYQALFFAAANQQFGAVNIVEGGFDYHNGGNNQANNRHVYIARFILLWAWTHICTGKNGVLQIDTDGGISWDQNGANPNALGDRGSSSQSLFLHVQGAGAAASKPTFRRQGYYNGLIRNGGGESSSRDPLVGKRAEMASIASVLTFGQLAGLVKTSDASAQEFLNAINARGTIIPGGVSQMMQLSMIA